MNRIPPLPYDEWDTEAMASFAPGRKLLPSNALGLFAQHPELATAFLGYSRYLLSRRSTLSPRTRELAILRVAWRRRCQYEWSQHVLIARKAGVTDEEIDAIRVGEPTPITRAVDELETDSGLSDDTYRALAADLNDRQLMDLVFTIGTYGLLAMVLNTFEVELDPGLPAENFTIAE